MEKIKTTLHPKDSPNDELYPNVLPSNIPVSDGLNNSGDKLSIDNTYVQEKLTASVGINIDENNKISVADSVPKQVEFSQGIKTPKVVDINGYTYLTGDSSYINVGNSSRLLQTYGSGSRPTYNGKDLALLSDSDTSHWDLLMANIGVGRWEGQKFFDFIFSDNSIFFDDIIPYYTDLKRFMCYSTWISRDHNTQFQANMIIQQDFINKFVNYNYAFYGVDMNSITLSNIKASNMYFSFSSTTLTKILVKEGCTVMTYNLEYTFANNKQLIEIGKFDLSQCINILNFIQNSPKVKSIHCTHWKVSFDISPSTAFEEADLVEIISNLDTVSTTQTLTMGATNLAKLTSEEILVATGKGWQLA